MREIFTIVKNTEIYILVTVLFLLYFFSEIVRVVDSLQLCAKHRVATPVDWQPGQKCVIQPTVKDEEVPTLFPKGHETIKLPSEKSYLRMTPQP